MKEGNFEKEALSHRPLDREAALELARTNPILMNDTHTFESIKRGGAMVEGKFVPIEDFGEFLAEREKEVRVNPPYGKAGPNVKKEHLVQHSDPAEKVE